jgi:hypothetical protein
MSDHDGVERAPEDEGPGLTRRDLLRLGLLTAAATQGPLAFAPPGAAQTPMKLGANLVGKLEGAEVITDPARFPKTFKEAPQLAELVKAGKLPPVQQRIGQDPLGSSPCGRSASTAARGAAALPGPSTPPTATGSPRTTSSSTTTTRAPSSCPTSPGDGR